MTKGIDAMPATPRRGVKPLMIGAAAILVIGTMTAHAASTRSTNSRAVSGFMSASLAAVLAAKNPAPAATPAPAPAAGIEQTQLGINLSTIAYWGLDRAFSNLIYGSDWTHVVPGRGWIGLDPSLIDANGWVKSLPAGTQAVRLLSQPMMGAGGVEVRCTYVGSGDIGVSGSVAAVRSGSNQLTFRMTGRYPTYENTWITITATNPSNPIRNIDCRETSKSSTEIFDPAFVAELRRFKVLRFMDWQNTNNNPTVNWSTRNQPFGGLYSSKDGVPVEVMVELTKLGTFDPWFTVPWNADDDYIRRFAEYARDNVPRDRKIYVEASNEVWNSMFNISGQARAEGQARGIGQDPFQSQLFRYSQRSAEILKIWTQVFAAEPQRLVRTVATQHVNPWTAEQVLSFGDTARWVDALATAPYFGHDVSHPAPPTSVEQLFQRTRAELVPTMNAAKSNKALAARYGKRYITYEAGQHVILVDNVPLMKAFNTDPRMYDLYRDYLNMWRSEVGGLLTLFATTGSISGFGAWGHKEYAGQPLSQTPKLRAIVDSGM